MEEILTCHKIDFNEQSEQSSIALKIVNQFYK